MAKVFVCIFLLYFKFILNNFLLCVKGCFFVLIMFVLVIGISICMVVFINTFLPLTNLEGVNFLCRMSERYTHMRQLHQCRAFKDFFGRPQRRKAKRTPYARQKTPTLKNKKNHKISGVTMASTILKKRSEQF